MWTNAVNPRGLSALWLAATWLPGTTANAQDLSLLTTGLNQPMVVTSASGDARMFVAEKTGVIRSVDVQTGASSVFLDLSSKVGTQGERGLLGLSFDPNFASNGRLYVNYSDKTTGNTVIERYTASGSSHATASIASAQSVMTIEQPAGETSHKAGWIGFRPGEPDNLYITTGDGAWRANTADPYQNSQNLHSNLGKMLRIDVNHDDFAGDATRNYAIPTGNPFAGATVGNDEIWAYGLRNPFRASFDSQSGDLWIADVGFKSWDEVTFLAAGTGAGANLGWDLREGTSGPSVPGSTDPIYTTPVGTGAAIIGGLVYHGGVAALNGSYVFADYVSGSIKSLRYNGHTVTEVHDWTSQWLASYGGANISSFGEDANGNLYFTDLNQGRVFVLSSPVPEPGSVVLMSFGLGALLSRKRTQLKQGENSKIS